MAEYATIEEEKKSCRSLNIISCEEKQKTASPKAAAWAINIASFFATTLFTNESPEFKGDKGAI